MSVHPWQRQVVERLATGLTETPSPENPLLFGIQTADGSHWFYRVGGAWDPTPPGTNAIYGCAGGPCLKSSPARVLVATEGKPEIDTSGPTWTVLMANAGGDPNRLPKPWSADIRRAWFITNQR